MNYKTFLLAFVILSFFSCKNEKKPSYTIIRDFKNIENIFNKSNDTVYVINFWATTCPPCLRELPMLDKLSAELPDKPIKTYLISIDNEDRIDKYVKPFLKKLDIKSDVYSLIDEDMSSWTAKINPEWYGALPYTIIYKGENKKYFFGAFKEHKDVEKEINSILNN